MPVLSGPAVTALGTVVTLLALILLLSYMAPPEVPVPSLIIRSRAIRLSNIDTAYGLHGAASRHTKSCLRQCSQDIRANRSTAVMHQVTLVTGYYRIPSKHPVDDYMARMGNFLLRIRTPTVVFTDNRTFRDVEQFPKLLWKRARLLPGRLHTRFLELESTPLAQEFGPVMKRQEHRDPEKFRGHNYLLYLVWLLKSEAILAAAAENMFSSDWFMWVDIGCFRDPNHKFQFWPSQRALNTVPKDRVFMELVKPFVKGSLADWLVGPKNKSEWLRASETDYIDGDHIAGTYIAVNIRRDTHLRFYRALGDAMRKLLTVDHLIIKDQTIFNAMYLLQPSLFAMLPCRDDAGYSNWVYMEPWLAEASERSNDVGLSSILLP